jgi:hypothetical protein
MPIVMAWLGHAIHVFAAYSKKDVDGRPSPPMTAGHRFCAS